MRPPCSDSSSVNGTSRANCLVQDDANNDPQWSEEQLLEAGFCLAGLPIGQCEVDIMNRSTVAIFEILEKAWATQGCTLVDMKVRRAALPSAVANVSVHAAALCVSLRSSLAST